MVLAGWNEQFPVVVGGGRWWRADVLCSSDGLSKLREYGVREVIKAPTRTLVTHQDLKAEVGHILQILTMDSSSLQ